MNTSGRMSKNNNVNPGQYKVAGRERPGEDVLASAHKAALTQDRAKQDQQPLPPRKSDDSGAGRESDASKDEQQR